MSDSRAKCHFALVGGVYIDEIHEVAAYPSEDSAIRAASVQRRRGGNVGNSAAVLSQLDAGSVEWVGVVPANGGDGAVAFALDSLHAYNVRTVRHERVQGEAIGMPTSMILSSRATGSRTIVSSRRGLRELCAEYFSREVLPALVREHPVLWLHFEGREPGSVARMVAEADRARLAAWRLSVEVEKPTFTPEAVLTLLAGADVAFVSREWVLRNAAALLGGEAASRQRQTERLDDCHLAIATLRALAGRSLAAAKRGSAGVTWVCAWGALGAFALTGVRDEGGRVVETCAVLAAASAVERVVDSVGAGDTFNAAVIASLAAGVGAGEALRAGCLVAGRKVAQAGFDGLTLPPS